MNATDRLPCRAPKGDPIDRILANYKVPMLTAAEKWRVVIAQSRAAKRVAEAARDADVLGRKEKRPTVTRSQSDAPSSETSRDLAGGKEDGAGGLAVVRQSGYPGKGRNWVRTMSVPGMSDSNNSLVVLKAETQKSWIEKVFYKRECIKYVPSHRDHSRCGCGRMLSKHHFVGQQPQSIKAVDDVWNVHRHTEKIHTDSYGTIEFQGGAHPNKAQYVRLAEDTPPEQIMQLLQQQWCLDLPKLLISVHGGIRNFDLQTKLKRMFRKGLLRAAKTTGAWILTGGTNTGVMKHVGDALGDSLVQSRNSIVTLGIAPWGVVHNRIDLMGRDVVTPYHAVATPKSNTAVLNSNHSYFMLVDNGTVDRFGCEIALRRRVEKFISQQKITTRSGTKSYSTPVVCLVLEGGTNTIRTVLECVTDNPPVPVVVCDGSGRAADLIAFTHKYAQDDGKLATMPESMRDQLILTIEKTFKYSRQSAEKVFIELMLCVKKRELITVFRMGEDSQEIDLAILTALLKGQNASAPDQLNLALTWNRVDIARTHIFVYGQEWPEGALDHAMMDALVNDRVDFVKLLLENGVSMHKWLTIGRLEELYNTGLKTTPAKYSIVSSLLAMGNLQKQDPASTLRYLIRENKKHIPPDYHYTLYDIGQVIEKLMGGAYRASYCRRKFRTMYNALMKKHEAYPPRRVQFELTGHNISNLVTEVPLLNPLSLPNGFKYPFSELMVWAVLMRRQKMAKFMWEHGEEAMAKALVASKLYKSMSHEAENDDLEVDVSQELKAYAKEFQNLAVELLEHCYQTDDDLTQQLLTYELQNWSEQTCLSLAVCANHRDFLANTSCQILLTDMWMGGLRMRKYTSLRVILGILVFPTIVCLEFKSKEELQLMPQTVEEHMDDLDSDSDSDSSDSPSTGEAEHEPEGHQLMAETPLSAPDQQPPCAPNGDLPAAPVLTIADIQRKNSPLRLGKKIYEFYTAPITKFWAHSIGYMVFLMLYTYSVLVIMRATPSWQEGYAIAYVLALAMEKVREVLVSEPKKLSQKLKVFYEDVWNISDTIAIVLYLTGTVLRLMPGLADHGKVFYCVSIVFWYVRILDLFAVSKYLGPYVMMIGKMVKDMLYFIVILVIILMAFGVVRQSITFPHEEPHWNLARDIFLKPYFMIYGEVYAPEIDPECSDEPGSEFKCVPGRFVVPAVMAIYLIVANILLINLLIAVFNNTFFQVNAISNQVWKFQRYSLVIEYESHPIMPPPFILLCHFYLLAKYIYRRCHGKMEFFDCALKLFLDNEDVERLHDFEEECMEDYFRKKEEQFMSCTEERIRVTNERVENLSLRLDDINQKENYMKLSLQTVDYRLAKLEDLSLQTMDTLCAVSQQLQSVLQLHQQQQQPSPKALAPTSYSSSSSKNCTVPLTVMTNDGSALDSALATPTEESDPNSRPPSFTFCDSSVGDCNDHSQFLLSSYPPPFRKSEERLRPFTDYRKPVRRPPFSRAFSVGTPSSVRQEFSSMDRSSTGLLYKRRHNSSQSRSSNSDQSEEDLPETKTVKKRSRPSDLRVTFEGHEADHHRRREKPSVGGRDARMCAKEAVPARMAKWSNHRYDTEEELLHHNLSPGSASMASRPSPCMQPAFDQATMPLTPIVTPTRVEYSSITDDIDTSCVNYRSPPGTPTTPRRVYFSDIDMYTQQPSRAAAAQSKPSQTVDEALKLVEESQHAQMESIIRKRMRQISLTESDSLGNIAKHVVEELEADELDALTQDSYHSDVEDSAKSRSSAKRKHLKRLKPVHSEPFLQSLVEPALCDQGTHNFRSLSPPASDPGIVDNQSAPLPEVTTTDTQRRKKTQPKC